MWLRWLFRFQSFQYQAPYIWDNLLNVSFIFVAMATLYLQVSVCNSLSTNRGSLGFCYSRLLQFDSGYLANASANHVELSICSFVSLCRAIIIFHFERPRCVESPPPCRLWILVICSLPVLWTTEHRRSLEFVPINPLLRIVNYRLSELP